ncbi:MAG TPA: hypothetical protein VLM36_13190, partial [Sphingomicrobium sp.]|nr:hypothetical protein [Sphingomicrobium sp.]
MATIVEPAAPRRRKTIVAASGLETERLVLSHIWVAITVFGLACLLGVWQMWARSPLNAPYHSAANYFRSVTM